MERNIERWPVGNGTEYKEMTATLRGLIDGLSINWKRLLYSCHGISAWCLTQFFSSFSMAYGNSTSPPPRAAQSSGGGATLPNLLLNNDNLFWWCSIIHNPLPIGWMNLHLRELIGAGEKWDGLHYFWKVSTVKTVSIKASSSLELWQRRLWFMGFLW